MTKKISALIYKISTSATTTSRRNSIKLNQCPTLNTS